MDEAEAEGEGEVEGRRRVCKYVCVYLVGWGEREGYNDVEMSKLMNGQEMMQVWL